MNPCAHHWMHNGHGKPGDAQGCNRPVRFVCVLCGLLSHKQCASGSERKCLPCATLKRGDLKAAARSGVTGNPADRIYFGTLTAPGDEPTKASGLRVRWDRSYCRHEVSVACSGKLGCVSDKNDLATWHRGLQKRWSYFRQHMRRSLAALSGQSVEAIDVQCMGAWEGQARGALHRHMLFRVSGAVTDEQIRRAFRMYRDAHDFGKQYDLQSIDTRDPKAMARKAGYIAKYITKGYDDLAAVPCGFDLHSATHLSGPRCTRRFRPWSASRSWGDTLRTCIMRRLQYAMGVNGAGAPLALATGTPAAGGRLDPYLKLSTTVDDTASVTDPEMVTM